jgi:3-isopropylmalate/(R)-2-methylmalate dehydratase small subunit
MADERQRHPSGSRPPRTWVLGDNLTTDALAPGAYMKLGIAEIARHCLESAVPEFASTVKPGDFVVGGRNFGAGSSREQAPEALRHLGVAAVLAQSYGGIFYRNAINLGLPVLVCAHTARITPDDVLSVDPLEGQVRILNTGVVLACEPIPPHLMAMLNDGGLVPHLKKRFAARRQEGAA